MEMPPMSIAIVNADILATIGLKQILQSVMPMATIDTCLTFSQLEAHGTDSYAHFFVDTPIVLQHMSFFTACRHKTIVLTASTSDSTQLAAFHCLCTNQSEEKFVKDLLTLEQNAHAHGRNLPPQTMVKPGDSLLSQREVEVLSHIAYGKTNKEIADTLCISVTTVVSHRKNIMDKLKLRNLSSLTIYAVMHGYVDVSKI